MIVVWQGSIERTPNKITTGPVFRVLVDDTSTDSEPSFLIERRSLDSLGEVKWDIESLQNMDYRKAISRALESLFKADKFMEGFKKCEFCEGAGWEVVQ